MSWPWSFCFIDLPSRRKWSRMVSLASGRCSRRKDRVHPCVVFGTPHATSQRLPQFTRNFPRDIFDTGIALHGKAQRAEILISQGECVGVVSRKKLVGDFGAQIFRLVAHGTRQQFATDAARFVRGAVE